MCLEGSEDGIFTCNDETNTKVITSISYFTPNFGGTDILTPINMAFTLDTTIHGPLKKRIMLLTDGEVANRDVVIELAKNEAAITHTFGIGSQCDKELVHGVAKSGRGSSSIVLDEDFAGLLNAKVVSAVQKALEPALQRCTIKWVGQDTQSLESIWRNQLILQTRIVPKVLFDDLSVQFKCGNNPMTNTGFEVNFTTDQFVKVSDDQEESLFKLVAHHAIQREANNVEAAIALSKKYQVVCEHTALIGTVAQRKATGELVQMGPLNAGSN